MSDEMVADEVVAEERISVQELVNRCVAAADNPDTSKGNRLLLINVIRALVELVTRLGAAEDQLASMEKPKSNLVFMPSREN